MHTTILQVVSKAPESAARKLNVHEAHTFEAKTKAASIAKAKRQARRWWGLDGEGADFSKIDQFDAADGLTYIQLHTGN